MARKKIGLRYTPHHRAHAEGHLYLGDDKKGACTIELTGAASMTQGELNKHGKRIVNALNAVTRIVALLDGEQEWDSETMGDLANILHDEGFKLREREDDDGE